MAAMTEHPKEPAPDDTSPAPPPTDTPSSEPTSRWDRVRPRGRLGQIATILVAAAAAVFIVGSIFVAGYVLGSEGGDEHDGHRGEGYSHSQGEQRGDRAESDESSDAGGGQDEPNHQNDTEQRGDSNDGDGPGSHG